MKTIRLLLVEDNKLLREGIMQILKQQTDIRVVAASSGKDNAVLKINELKPNVVLLDLGLRSQNSLDVVKLVKAKFPDAKVIVMDLVPVPADMNLFVKAGATGFILRDVTVEQFLQTIRTVAEGKTIVPPMLPESLFAQIVHHALKGKSATKMNVSQSRATLVKRIVKQAVKTRVAQR